MELKAVTNPDIIDAPKCKPMPSLTFTTRTIIFQIIGRFKRYREYRNIIKLYINEVLQIFIYFLEVNVFDFIFKQSK